MLCLWGYVVRSWLGALGLLACGFTRCMIEGFSFGLLFLCNLLLTLVALACTFGFCFMVCMPGGLQLWCDAYL